MEINGTKSIMQERINELNLISGGQYRKYIYVYVTRA